MMAVMATELAVRERLDPLAWDFDEWMRQEQKRVFLLCWRMLRDRDEADSATQDIFLKAYRAVERAPGGIEDRARWLTRVTVNTCLDRLRSRRWQFWRRRAGSDAEEAVFREEPVRGPDAEDQIFAHQVACRLDAALGRLSDRQRAVFLLRHFEDRSLEEIANVLSVDLGTVKAHMFRATAKLREELRDLYELGRKR